MLLKIRQRTNEFIFKAPALIPVDDKRLRVLFRQGKRGSILGYDLVN